jgi:hypothetical protein
MGTEWYYAKNKQQHGPVSSAGLKELAQSGELRPTDKIWKAGLPDWMPASSLDGLFPAETDVTAAPPRKKAAPKPPPEPEDEPDTDEEDRPRRKKKKPAKSGGGARVLLWVLGGVAAILLLFCLVGGIIGLVYSGALTALQPVNVTNVFKVKAGMSQKECEALMGLGKVVSRQTVPAAGVFFRPPNLPKKATYEVKSVLWEDGRGGHAELSFVDDKCAIGF